MLHFKRCFYNYFIFGKCFFSRKIALMILFVKERNAALHEKLWKCNFDFGWFLSGTNNMAIAFISPQVIWSCSMFNWEMPEKNAHLISFKETFSFHKYFVSEIQLPNVFNGRDFLYFSVFSAHNFQLFVVVLFSSNICNWISLFKRRSYLDQSKTMTRAWRFMFWHFIKEQFDKIKPIEDHII